MTGLSEAEAREEARDAGNKPRPADGTPNRRRLVGETGEEWKSSTGLGCQRARQREESDTEEGER